MVQILIERVALSPYKYTPCDHSSTCLFLLLWYQDALNSDTANIEPVVAVDNSTSFHDLVGVVLNLL